MEYEIYQHDELVEVVTHGDADLVVFQNFLNEIIKHPNWKPGFPILIDHSDLNGKTLTVNGMQKLADMIHVARIELGSSHMAIIVPGDLIFGLGRMWQVYSDGKWNGVSEVFRTKEEAVDWLMLA